MSFVRLHPEHGVNPTVTKCFWCGKDIGVALLGAAYKGEAPRHMVLDYEPCDECKSNMEKGIALIECEQSIHDLDRPAIQQGLYPTGSWAVITEDAARRWFEGTPQLEAVMKKRKAFVEKGFLKSVGAIQ